MSLKVFYKTLFWRRVSVLLLFNSRSDRLGFALQQFSLLGERMDCLNGSTHIYTFTDARTPARTQGAREIKRGRG